MDILFTVLNKSVLQFFVNKKIEKKLLTPTSHTIEETKRYHATESSINSVASFTMATEVAGFPRIRFVHYKRKNLYRYNYRARCQCSECF